MSHSYCGTRVKRHSYSYCGTEGVYYLYVDINIWRTIIGGKHVNTGKYLV